MKTYIIAFLAVIVSAVLLDSVWLSTMIKSFYSKYLGEIFASTPSLSPAVVFYILYAIGIVVFIILPALANGYSLWKVALFGALFGLVSYGTYDLTNQATLKHWVTIVTIVDMAWGAILTATSSTVAVFVTRFFN